MPIKVSESAPTLVIRKDAFERAGLIRADIDQSLGLTDEEFKVEGGIVVIGPVFDADAFGAFLVQLEELGLTYFDDFFELSGNWPSWLSLFAMARNNAP